MKVISIAVAGVSLALIALTLVPSAGDYRPYLAVGALVCAAVALVTIIVGWREPPPAVVRPQAVESTRATSPRQEAAGPAAVNVPSSAPGPNAGAAEVVAFLATLQEKGRLVDFLEDDITGYSDAQVGAAARVVHQGCQAVLHQFFRIVPVRAENEGAQVTVAAGYAADEYRLVGKISGQAPFSGTLMHRGWKADAVTLPRVLRPDDNRLPTIAPAEVELR
jgi:hypothetical protein